MMEKMEKIDIKSEAWNRYETESNALYTEIVLAVPRLDGCDILDPEYQQACERFDDAIAELQDRFGWTDMQVAIAEAECWEAWCDRAAYPSDDVIKTTFIHMDDDTEPDVEA